MPNEPFKSALLIAGPTASGKSALALRLARERNGVVINADSMQVYRELRVLSARPSVDEVGQVPHRLYGHVSGADEYSVARWLGDTTAAVEACWRAGQLPIICGGTGLYFKALTDGLAEVPSIDPAVRETWRGFSGDVHGELAQRDPEGAARLNPADRQRIVRALEVIEGTGHTLQHWQALGRGKAFLNHINVERLFVDVPREVLHARADARLLAMVEAGALDEVRPIMGWKPDLPVMKAIGVPEFACHLRGEYSLEDAVARAQAATRQYIKRQTTWWRGQMAGWQSYRPGG